MQKKLGPFCPMWYTLNDFHPHGNVDSLTKAYERVGDLLKDDDFLDVTIMTINVKEALKEYRKIIQYLDGMKFLNGTTKVV